MISPSDFAALFDDYYPKLYAYVRGQVTNRETAEDITATAFERALSRSHTYDTEKGTFAAWLFRIARNLIINHYVSTSRKPAQYGLDETVQVSITDLSPEQQLLRQEQHRILLAAISRLSERDQEIVRLKFFGRLSNRKIAEVMEVNENTVGVIIFRSLKKLRTQLEAQEAQ
jgi:RNA polymerase sigma factor (sigma-70 family)